MPQDTPIVFVVDDDVSVRESLQGLIMSAGWAVETFATAQQFLSRLRSPNPSCLILDISLPDIDGLEVQERVSHERGDMPIIFITGYNDVPMTVRAMKGGAIEFLTKPFSDDTLLGAIKQALARSQSTLEQEAVVQDLKDCYATLSRREREVLGFVVLGLLNKQVGGELGISEITVKAHRGKMMEKMRAGSFAELVNMAGKLGLTSAAKG